MQAPEHRTNGQTGQDTATFGGCPMPIRNQDTVQLGHGSGGIMSNELISEIFVSSLQNTYLNELDDCVHLPVGGEKIAFSTDSYVVDPIFFPGGDIGDLAVNGTVNDLSMRGARPLFLSLAVILEEGFPLVDLRRIVDSIHTAASRANVQVVTGDTKVLNRGKGDKIFINTSGIGVLERDIAISAGNLRHGDAIIVSGGLAEHGMAILSKREGLAFETSFVSDTAALNALVATILDTGGCSVHAMRDPTRGGVAATLNEFATASSVGIQMIQDRIPVKPAVSGACEFLGIDPLYVANEGKVVIAVESSRSEEVLRVMRTHPLATDSVIIGHVVDQNPGMVTMSTAIGGSRIVDMMVGEQLPRIC